jgi:hypothetical protein
MKNLRAYLSRAVIVTAMSHTAVTAANAAGPVHADFNGDGFEDLAVGAPDQFFGAGVLHVYYGTASGLGTLDQAFFQDTQGLATEIAEAGDHFAAALATGDFNGDGFADLAVGSPGEDLSSGGQNRVNAGCVHILYGSAVVGLTVANNQMWNQDSPGIFGAPDSNAAFGAALAAADFNHDGFDDLAVGVPGHNINGQSGVGAVIKINGSAAGLTSLGSQGLHEAAIFGIPQFAEAGDGFGSALAAGDFGGDGFADLAIGIPGEDFSSGTAFGATDRGAVVIVYGSPIGLNFSLRDYFDQDRVGMLDDAEAFDRFGAVLAAGDFNGDGRDDLAIGIPQEDIVGTAGNVINTGAVAILYGSNIGGGLRVDGNQFWHQDVAGIEDINETGDQFGRALTVGDFNGDGIDDLAIGVPFEDLGGIANSGIQDAGAVEVIYGSAAGLTAVSDQRWSQNNEDFVTHTAILDDGEFNDQFGLSLAAGDFNGDGRDDLAVGVPGEDRTAVDTGVVNVIYGAAAGGLAVPGNQLLFPTLLAGDRFGTALASLGSGSASK